MGSSTLWVNHCVLTCRLWRRLNLQKHIHAVPLFRPMTTLGWRIQDFKAEMAAAEEEERAEMLRAEAAEAALAVARQELDQVQPMGPSLFPITTWPEASYAPTARVVSFFRCMALPEVQRSASLYIVRVPSWSRVTIVPIFMSGARSRAGSSEPPVMALGPYSAPAPLRQQGITLDLSGV